MKYKKTVIFSVFFLLICIFWNLYVGYFVSRIDHETHDVYFFKKFPTFRREFVNPFANEGDPLPVNEMPEKTRKFLEDYCKYRYGIIDTTTESLEKCKSIALLVNE
ncbi:hypothetical protein JOE11_003695 [Robbsia andropogonis]